MYAVDIEATRVEILMQDSSTHMKRMGAGVGGKCLSLVDSQNRFNNLSCLTPI